MEPPRSTLLESISQREERFLDRLTRKYQDDENAGRIRSYVIASVVILAMFAISRWIPWWIVALLTVEAVGLMLFRQYKRFAHFKSQLLTKLWRCVRE